MPARACHECPPPQAIVHQAVANRQMRLYFCGHSTQSPARGKGRGACLHDVTEVTGDRRLVAYWLVPLNPLTRVGEGGAWLQVGGCCPAHQQSERSHDQHQSIPTKDHSVHEGCSSTGDAWGGPGYGDTSWQCSQDQAKLIFLDSLSAVLSVSSYGLEGGATSERVCADTPHHQWDCSPPTGCKREWEWQGTSTSPRDSVVQHPQDGFLQAPVAGLGSPSCVSGEVNSWLSMAEECVLTESMLEGLSEPWDSTCCSQTGRGRSWEELLGQVESVSVRDSEWFHLQSPSCGVSKHGTSTGRDSTSDTHCLSPVLLGPATPTASQCWRGPLLHTAEAGADHCQDGESPLLFSPTPRADRRALTATPTSATPLCRIGKVVSQQTLLTTCQDCNTPENGCATCSHVTAVDDTPLNGASQLYHSRLECSPELFPPTP